MGSTPRSIQSLLHTATPDIADLVGRAHFLARIRSVLLEVVPTRAGPQVHVAAYEQCRLTLHVGHAGWATRLRYMQSAMAQALAQQMRLHVETVQIRVRPDIHRDAEPARPRHISAANRAHIAQIASYVSNAPLADALTRLARTGAARETYLL